MSTTPPTDLPVIVIPQSTLHTLADFGGSVWTVVQTYLPTFLSWLSTLNLKGEQAMVAEANAENPYEGMLASAIGGVLLRLMGSKEQAIVTSLFTAIADYLKAHA